MLNEPPPHLPLEKLAYYSAALMLGALSALANLLGSERVLNARIILAYILAGSLVSLGLVLLLVERYGQSPFLIGTAIFAGYKATDLLALGGLAVAKVFRIYRPGHHPEHDPSNHGS